VYLVQITRLRRWTVASIALMHFTSSPKSQNTIAALRTLLPELHNKTGTRFVSLTFTPRDIHHPCVHRYHPSPPFAIDRGNSLTHFRKLQYGTSGTVAQILYQLSSSFIHLPCHVTCLPCTCLLLSSTNRKRKLHSES